MDNNTKKLLLIENDAVISETIQKSLERYNYSVVSAYTGDNALEILSKNNDIDLVLISIDIADAVETASAILHQKETPILFLSEHDESEMYSKTENIKCYGYVLKNSGAALIDASIKTALILFNDRRQADVNQMKYKKLNHELESILDHLPALVFYKDKKNNFIRVNKYIAQSFNKNKSDVEGVSVYDIYPKEEADKYYQDDLEVINSGVAKINIEETWGSSARLKWANTSKIPFIDENGEIIGVIGISLDITDKKIADDKIKQLLAEKEIILKEVHHRIKNNMNTIISLLLLQTYKLHDASAVAALNNAANRIQSMLILYDKLYQSKSFNNIAVSDYLPALIDEIISNFPNIIDLKIDKKIENFILNVKKMQPLGIIINELLTNTMKYAFTGKNNGLISVSAALSHNTVTLIIADNGIGIPESIDFKNSTGFGMQLVSLLVDQIDGRISIERGQGTKFIIEFEL